MCGCLSHAPYWGPGPQPRYVPGLGLEPAILWFTGLHSISWATPARGQMKVSYTRQTKENDQVFKYTYLHKHTHRFNAEWPNYKFGVHRSISYVSLHCIGQWFLHHLHCLFFFQMHPGSFIRMQSTFFIHMPQNGPPLSLSVAGCTVISSQFILPMSKNSSTAK